MGGVTHNEILKVLKSYGIKNAVKLSEEDAKKVIWMATGMALANGAEIKESNQ